MMILDSGLLFWATLYILHSDRQSGPRSAPCDPPHRARLAWYPHQWQYLKISPASVHSNCNAGSWKMRMWKMRRVGAV